MKKKFLAYLCVCASSLLLAGGTSYAAATSSSQASSTAGGLVTLGVATAGGVLTFNPSPNVLIDIASTANSYAIQTANTVTDTTNGMEYGTLSTASGYAQRTKTADASTAIAPPSSDTALSGSGWKWMGGS